MQLKLSDKKIRQDHILQAQPLTPGFLPLPVALLFVYTLYYIHDFESFSQFERFRSLKVHFFRLINSSIHDFSLYSSVLFKFHSSANTPITSDNNVPSSKTIAGSASCLFIHARLHWWLKFVSLPVPELHREALVVRVLAKASEVG